MKPSENQPQPTASQSIQLNEIIPNYISIKPTLQEYRKLNDQKILDFWKGLKNDYDNIHINGNGDPKKRDFIIKNIEFYENKLK